VDPTPPVYATTLPIVKRIPNPKPRSNPTGQLEKLMPILKKQKS